VTESGHAPHRWPSSVTASAAMPTTATSTSAVTAPTSPGTAQISNRTSTSRLLKTPEIKLRIVKVDRSSVRCSRPSTTLADHIMLQPTFARCWRQGRDPRRLGRPPTPRGPPGQNLIGTCNTDRGDHLPRSALQVASQLGNAPLQPPAPRPPAGVSCNTISHARLIVGFLETNSFTDKKEQHHAHLPLKRALNRLLSDSYAMLRNVEVRGSSTGSHDDTPRCQSDTPYPAPGVPDIPVQRDTLYPAHPLHSLAVSLAFRARANSPIDKSSTLGEAMGAGQQRRSTSFTRVFIRPRSCVASGSLESHRRPASR
jgi:hypothetical protein